MAVAIHNPSDDAERVSVSKGRFEIAMRTLHGEHIQTCGALAFSLFFNVLLILRKDSPGSVYPVDGFSMSSGKSAIMIART